MFRIKPFVAAVALAAVSVAAAQPAPPPPAASDERPVWYYAVSGRAEGPLTLSQLRQAAAAGSIRVDTQVFHPDHQWRFAKDVPELAGFIPAAAAAGSAPTPPPPPPPTRQQQFDTSISDYLVGTWRLDQTQTVGTTTFFNRIEWTLNPGGQLVGTVSSQMAAQDGITMPPSIMPVRGTWLVQAQDERNFALTITHDADVPRTFSASIVDRNTVQLSTGGKLFRIR